MAGKTALLQLPLNYRYHSIHLVCTAFPATSGKKISNLPTGAVGTAWINDIRVRMNGRIQRTHTADELNRMNSVNGSAYAAVTVPKASTNDCDYGQVLPIFFAEPWREDQPQKEFGAIPAQRLTDFALEIDLGTPLDDASTAAASTPTITAFAIVDIGDQPGANNNGLIVGKVFRLSLAASTGPSVVIDVPNLDRRDLYQAIHVDLSGGVVATPNATKLSTIRAVLKSSGLTISETPQDVEKAIGAQYGLNSTRQFDASIVFDLDDPIQSGLNANGLPDLQLRIESGNVASGSTATWKVIQERMGPPE